MKKAIVVVSILVLASCTSRKNLLNKYSIDPFSYTVTKKLNVRQAAVVSAHPLASSIGAAVMRDGGNAFDAAIATQLALAV
ncbi:MAG TPA: gamma-glutamyltransferase, partial [Flavisolibacter sp.]